MINIKLKNSMKKKILIKKFIVATLGILVLGFGIGMLVKVDIGADSLSATYQGVSKLTNLSVGTITSLANVIMVIVSLILNKKNVGIATILFIFLSKWPVDLGEKLMLTSTNIFISILLCLLSIFVIAIGSVLFIISGLGANAYDTVIIGIGDCLHKNDSYVYIRWIMDGLLLIVAYFTGGTIGIGTILSFGVIGVFVKIIKKAIEKPLSTFINN